MTSEATILKFAKESAKILKLRPLRVSMRQGVEAGWPDLFVFGPNRYILGVETKRPGATASPIQLERAREMSMFGHAWCKPDSKEAVAHALVNFARHCVGIGDPISAEEAMKVLDEIRANKETKKCRKG